MAAINYQLARFEASYGTVEQLPEPTTPEVAVAGRSNVGKSSLLNKVFGRKNLVKVSARPPTSTSLRSTASALWTCPDTATPRSP